MMKADYIDIDGHLVIFSFYMPKSISQTLSSVAMVIAYR